MAAASIMECTHRCASALTSDQSSTPAVRVSESANELLGLLAADGLAEDTLDPWLTWKVFKKYLAQPVDEVYDAASFQTAFEAEVGPPRLYAMFVRQFSERNGEEDVGIRRVVVEFELDPGRTLLSSRAEIWTLDFPTGGDFATVVEGNELFQWLCNSRPVTTRVFSEEL
jgi:hypothetical protein